MTDERNVVLIVLDTVRKDYFDEYANNLQEKSGSSFSQCRAASSWSVPSHASIFTGEMPSQHELHAESFGKDYSFSEISEKSFTKNLTTHRTVGLSANPYANSMYDFDSLFDEFNDFITHESLFNSGLSPYSVIGNFEGSKSEKAVKLFKESLRHDRPVRSLANSFWSGIDIDVSQLPLPGFLDDGASAISKSATESVSKDEPFFMFINYMDAHTPLSNVTKYDQGLHDVSNKWSSDEYHNWELNKEGEGTEEYKENYRALYGAAIDYLDRTIDNFIEEIENRTDRPTTFVITADHGHNLGHEMEDGYFHHAGNLSEGLLHVPLEIVNPPEELSDDVSGFFSHKDLGDLLVKIAQGEKTDDIGSEEIAAEAIGLTGTGDPRNHRDFTEEEWNYWNRMIRAIYRDQEKVVWDSLGDREIYSLDFERPGWQEKIESEDVDIEELENEFFSVSIMDYKEKYSSSENRTSEEAVKDRLEKLGYM